MGERCGLPVGDYVHQESNPGLNGEAEAFPAAYRGSLWGRSLHPAVRIPAGKGKLDPCWLATNEEATGDMDFSISGLGWTDA